MESDNKKSIIERVNKKLFLNKYDIIPFIPYSLFLPALIEKDYSVYFAFLASMLGIVTVLMCYVIRPERGNNKKDEQPKTRPKVLRVFQYLADRLHKKDEQPKTRPKVLRVFQYLADSLHEKDEQPKTRPKVEKFFLIFGAIYVIIAGVAFTHGIDTFLLDNKSFTTTQNASDLVNFIQDNKTILFYSFFAVAILFFHCGLLFLSIEGIRYLTAGEDTAGNKNKGNEIIFCNVILLFAEAVILYFIADSVRSISRFSLWVMVLMSVDIFWTILQRFVFIKKHGDWEKEVPFEWIHLDLLTLGFLWFLLLAFQSDKISDAKYYWLLLSVLFSSTAVNYIAMWRRIWSKIRIESAG